ncbi:hypothetical protein FA15DRAFT_642671 [Coprinopsis marcescibilis]|uniref:Uncharacterized protein n=1 Tax=Coprinopsis marcescibilis TaxID=230819 RepID=A0A5C3KRQ9_COPMA|nr:hypothetical protein FA15DRAFT_642671 [Coprinopsis marcescibilis]
MGQVFDEIPGNLIPWILAQKLFWVATAPLAEDGHVNVSPKGCFDKTLNIIREERGADGKEPNARAVWYEDFTGSGVETISHLYENGRITMMFVAFEGPPQIIRLYGTGKVYEYGTPEYAKLLPSEQRQPGSRAAIWIDVHRVSTSCGFSIPFFEYKAPRIKLHKVAMTFEQNELDPPADDSAQEVAGFKLDKSMKAMWRIMNLKSIDGLPGLAYAFDSPEPLTNWKKDPKGIEYRAMKDDESVSKPKLSQVKARSEADAKPISPSPSSSKMDMAFGIAFGVLIGIFASRQWESRVLPMLCAYLQWS